MPTSRSKSKSTPRKDDARQGADLLLDVAQRLFTERGYAHVSMQQIAEEAGMTKGAPYYHFQNKEELFARVSVRILKELKASIDTACESEGSFEQVLNRVILTAVKSTSGNLEQWFADYTRLLSPATMVATVSEGLGTTHLSELLLPDFEKAFAEGIISRATPETATRVFIDLLMMKIKNQAYHTHIGEGGDAWLEQSTRDLIDIFLHGVS
ncbi:MAG: TetR/AcrR family transcriptional regulator [Thermomicrobiales bacterium]